MPSKQLKEVMARFMLLLLRQERMVEQDGAYMAGKIRAFLIWIWSPFKKPQPVEDLRDDRFTSLSQAQAEAIQRQVEQEHKRVQATKKHRRRRR